MRTTSSQALAACVLAIAGMISTSAAYAAPSDEQAVRQATNGFYAALNDMFTGNIEPMQNVWSHANDVTYMGPDGKFIVGWDHVLPEWQSQAARKLSGEIRSEQIQVNVGNDLATVQCREVGQNVVNGKPTRVTIRATNVFRKENGQWKMIGHHTDTLPFLQK
jgi:ketosteroid isomerase-like protein